MFLYRVAYYSKSKYIYAYYTIYEMANDDLSSNLVCTTEYLINPTIFYEFLIHFHNWEKKCDFCHFFGLSAHCAQFKSIIHSSSR